MKRNVSLVLVGIVAAAFVVTGSAQDAKTPTIKDVMGKLTKGQNSLTTTIAKGLNADEPTWDDIKKQSKEFCTFSEALGKNKPPKGDDKSWTKLTDAYNESAKALAEAADKMDKKAAMAAIKKLQGSCMNCHRAHKGK
jgi:cytochrome c556